MRGASKVFKEQWLQPVLAADQPGNESLPLTFPPHSSRNYRRGLDTAFAGGAPECPPWRVGEALPLDPTGHLPHQATPPSLGAVAAPPHTQKQTQGGCQSKQAKKHGPNERTEQSSRKRAKLTGDGQPRCRVQNTGYQDAQRT